jgi:murein L,D-transpeptidase YcbB/YkuD
MRGSDVAELMRLLVGHGFLASNDVNSESLFDSDVELAVKAFQRSRAVEDDGVVGRVTAGLLKRSPGGN